MGYPPSGDNATTARAVAAKLGIAQVEADMQPGDKTRMVLETKVQGRHVAMAGDDVNNAPALASADVGIAMGQGTGIAIESAKATLVKGDLRGIVRARVLSRYAAQHSSERVVRVLLHRHRHSDCSRRAVSVDRLVAQPDDCRAGQ